MMDSIQSFMSFKVWMTCSIGLHALAGGFFSFNPLVLPQFTLTSHENSTEAHFTHAAFIPSSSVSDADASTMPTILNNDQGESVQACTFAPDRSIQEPERMVSASLPNQSNASERSLASHEAHALEDDESKCPLRRLIHALAPIEELDESPYSAASSFHGVSSYHPPCPICNPEPRYPIRSRRAGHEGTVKLKVSVDASGHSTAIEVMNSSGYVELDQRARDTVLNQWRFTPAQKRQENIAAQIDICIKFEIKDKYL